MAKLAPETMVKCERCAKPHWLCLRDRPAHYAALDSKSSGSGSGSGSGSDSSRAHNPKRDSRQKGEGPEARKRRNGSR